LRSNAYLRRIWASALAALAVFAGVVVVDRVADAATRVPAQLVAKLYSEALGRMPDAGGWTFYLNTFATKGCNTKTVTDLVRTFYASSEFLNLPYGNAQRVLALYRGALNREPDQRGLDFWRAELDRAQVTWSDVVDEVAGSFESARLAHLICTGPGSYSFGTTPAATLQVPAEGFPGGSGAQLQAALDSAPAGGTVHLAHSAVVRLDSMLVIPAGKTLATVARPAPNAYALQGRLVRTSSFAAPAVRLNPGARLVNVWVDGQRGNHANFTSAAINVQVLGGSGSEVSGSKITNSRGWTSLLVLGKADNQQCDGATVSGNLVTAYSSDHQPAGDTGRWTDGLSISCERATVEGNGIIDATDVGIVVFRAPPAAQASLVRGNQVLNAGNSAYGAIVVDGLYDAQTPPDFTGLRITGNMLWTGPDTHFDIGLAVGTRPWFGARSSTGTGASVTGNTTNGLTAIVGTGIAVSGMSNATVRDNDLRLSVRAISNCPHVAFGVDNQAGAGGGTFEPDATAVAFVNQRGEGCIGHLGG
jgi:hypothetical protein